MPKPRAFLKYWLPVLVWMALIFTGSGDARSYQHSAGLIEPFLHWLFPWLSQPHVEVIHHLIRKCVHLTEYAVLALLLWRALRQPVWNDPRPWNWREARLTLLVVMVYAATDEFHQHFIPERMSLVSDVMIDTFGGSAGLFALWILGRLRKHW